MNHSKSYKITHRGIFMSRSEFELDYLNSKLKELAKILEGFTKFETWISERRLGFFHTLPTSHPPLNKPLGVKKKW